MIKKFKKHVGYYVSLVLIFVLGGALMFISGPDIKLQTIIFLITIFFYILWALFHHYLNHELTSRIVIEYILIGVLGMSIFFFFIMGGLL